MIKVSVVIPIYNTKTYLNKCIDSLLNQTLKEIEIILVNDGSTDGSEIILRDYAQKYPEKITLLEQENKGMSMARNAGLAIAKGKYLGFVDSDDWVLETMYQEMVDLAEKDELDIVISDTVDHYPTYKVEHNASRFDSKYTVTPSACNKLFLASFIGDARFPEGLWYEDFCFTTLALMRTDKIGSIHKPFYNCHCREVSIMSNHNSQRNLDILKVLDIIKDSMKTNEIWDRDEMIFQYLVFDHILITSINRVYEQKSDSKKLVLKEFDKYVKNTDLDFDKIREKFDIPNRRMLVAKLNYNKLYFVSYLILRISAKLKGRA